MAEASSTEEGITLRIRFKSETLEKFAARYAGDLTPGEIFVRTREPLAVGTRLGFDFTLQDGSPLLAGRGTVGWTREPDLSRPEPSGMGIQFDSLTPVAQQMLGRILDYKARTAANAAGAGGRSLAGPEHLRATAPYRTVVPDDPLAALAAAGSVARLARGGLGGQPGPMGGAGDRFGGRLNADFAAPAPDAERTEISRVPPSFYYDAAEDETTRLQADEEIIEEGITPLDDLDDITSPRAEMPVHMMPTGPDLSIPWKPPTPPVAGSLAASLRPPAAHGGAGASMNTMPGRPGVDAPTRRPEYRETLGFGASAAASQGHGGTGGAAASLRPTNTRINALGPGLGQDEPTPLPEMAVNSVDSIDDVSGPPVPLYEPAPVVPLWESSPAPRSRRGGTGKVWLATAVTAAAVIGGVLWMVPKFMAPVPSAGNAQAPQPPASARANPGEGAGPAAAPGAVAAVPPGAAPSTSAGAPPAGAKAGGSVAPAAGQAGVQAAAGSGSGKSAPAAAAGGAAATGGAAPGGAAAAKGANGAASEAFAVAPVMPSKTPRKVRTVRARRPPAAGSASDPMAMAGTSGTPAAPAAIPEGINPPPPATVDPAALPVPGSMAAAPVGSAPGPGAAPAAASGGLAGAPTPAVADEDVYWLSVKSVPPGADVLIDGQVEGKTPFQRRIFDPGRTYALSIRKPGFESVDRSLTTADQWLKRGNMRTLTINARLMASANPEPPTAAVEGTSPSGATRPPAPSPSPPSDTPATAPPPASSAPAAPAAVPERKTNPFDEPAAGNSPR